jgi:hypothetical protein
LCYLSQRPTSRLQPQVPLFTIDDNIITTKGNKVIARELMQQQMERWRGYKPNVDSKDLTPPFASNKSL